MEGAVNLRTAAFGGFKKEDVLKQIEEQKDIEAGLLKKLEEASCSLGDVDYDRATGLEREVMELRQRAALQASELYMRDSQIAAMRLDSEKLRAVEGQLGKAFVDAQIYANSIIGEARDRAKKITDAVNESISDVTRKISQITSEMSSFTGTFSDGFTDLLVNLSKLAKFLEASSAETADIAGNWDEKSAKHNEPPSALDDDYTQNEKYPESGATSANNAEAYRTPAPNAEPVFKTREEGVLYPAGIYADPDDNAHLSASAEPEAAVSADIADCYRIQRPADYFGYEN